MAKQSFHVTIITVWVPDPANVFDMMRYDQCFPATEADSVKLRRMVEGPLNAGSAPSVDNVVRFMRVSPINKGPTLGRWESFGCKVLDQRGPNEPLTDDDMRRLMFEARAR